MTALDDLADLLDVIIRGTPHDGRDDLIRLRQRLADALAAGHEWHAVATTPPPGAVPRCACCTMPISA